MVDDERENDKENENDKHKKRKSRRMILKYLIDLGLVITFAATFITGVIKFPGFLNFMDVHPGEFPMYEISQVHDYSAIIMGFLILGHLLLNLRWFKITTVRLFSGADGRRLLKRLGVFFIVALLLILIFTNPAVLKFLFGPSNVIRIEGVGEFEYDPDRIESLRPEIFRDGQFSVFDILVDIHDKNDIDMKYHFDESLNTHVIDEINGMGNWWYSAYYDGGWRETNVFRMDHYPYKENMYIEVVKIDKSRLDSIHDVFRKEVQRKQENGGKVIIPKVIIDGDSFHKTFENVEVKPHNQRDDIFQDDVITAIDVIMTLGDEGKISYDLSYYESVGTARVKTYFVDEINGDRTHGRCGFVYEEGANEFSGFSGNHIHIPSDIRVINSPEYMEWFWICI